MHFFHKYLWDSDRNRSDLILFFDSKIFAFQFQRKQWWDRVKGTAVDVCKCGAYGSNGVSAISSVHVWLHGCFHSTGMFYILLYHSMYIQMLIPHSGLPLQIRVPQSNVLSNQKQWFSLVIVLNVSREHHRVKNILWVVSCRMADRVGTVLELW